MNSTVENVISYSTMQNNGTMYCIVLYNVVYLQYQNEYKTMETEEITKDDIILSRIENTKAQMRKGVLELCVMAIIAGQESYPSEIIEKLKESKLIVVEGTLYPLLTRLKNAELLDYSWRESNAGPPRKYYTVTEAGERFLNELLDTWQELNNAVFQSSKSTIINE